MYVEKDLSYLIEEGIVLSFIDDYIIADNKLALDAGWDIEILTKELIMIPTYKN